MRKIETLTPEKAAVYLRNMGLSTTAETLRQGISQGVYPFGVAIRLEKSVVYQIFLRQLDDWISERAVES